jgi:zinc protease
MSGSGRYKTVFWMILLGATAQGWTRAGASGRGETEMIQTSMGTPQVGLETYKLPNGMHVILHVDRKLPIVHVNLCFHVGSKDEERGRFGFAHLFEHMMFQGSKNADEQYIGLVEKAGANLFEGGVNGNTEEDRTNYFETVPSGNLEYILWLESDRVATLPEAITQKKFDAQREVVKNEIRQTQFSRPYGRAPALIYENLFPAGHPYAHHPIGNEKDLAAASLDDIKDFFRTYYTPSNLSLVISGDFDPAEAKKLVEKYFAGIPPGPPLQHVKRLVPEVSGQTILEVKDRVSQDRSYMAWVTPAFFEPDDAELDLTAIMLAGGISARLNRALIQDHSLCSEVSAEHDSFEAAGMLTLSATIKPGVEFADVEKIIAGQIAQLARDGPTNLELSRAKMKWESGLITKLEKIGGFGGKSDLFNRYSTFLGVPDKIAADIDRHRAVTADAVRRAAQTWLTPNRGLLLRFSRDTAIAARTKLDRSQAPSFGKNSPFHAPQVQSARLENGLEVFVAERHDLPEVAVTLVTRAGSADDPVGKDGLAGLLVEAIKGGTEKMSAEEVENGLDDLGASLEGQVDRDFSVLDLEVLKANAGPALTIFADLIQRPAFAEDTVSREKASRLSWLAEAYKNSQYLGGLLSPMLAFGSGHPYGHPVQGLPSTVQTITGEDLRRFHSSYWKPGGAALIFAGDISFSEAVELAKKNFAGWPRGVPPSLEIPPPTPSPGTVFVVDMPGAAQTMVRQILLLPGSKSPDYAAIQLADAVWGGGSAARLNLNLRENKGYAFAVFSHPFVFLNYGTWQSYGSVQTEKTGDSLAEFRVELEGLAGEKPISSLELSGAKSNRVHGYTQQFESLASISHEIAQLWAGGLPMAQFKSDIDALQNVDLNAVNAAARRYALPAKVKLLLIGDLEKLGPQLKSAGIEHFELVDAEGRPVAEKVH